MHGKVWCDVAVEAHGTNLGVSVSVFLYCYDVKLRQ